MWTLYDFCYFRISHIIQSNSGYFSTHYHGHGIVIIRQIIYNVLFSVSIECTYNSQQPQDLPTLKLAGTSRDGKVISGVDIIQNMMAYAGIWCCPKCHKEFTVSACMCFSSRLELLMWKNRG